MNSEPSLAADPRLRAAEERTLEHWIEAVASHAAGSTSVHEMQRSLSWRITRPIRLAETVLHRVRLIGLRRTAKQIRERLALGRRAKRRG